MELLFFLVPMVIAVVFAGVILTLLYRAVTGLAEWTRNNSQAVQEASARVVAKRSEIQGRMANHPHGRVYTYYFATFETRSGERVEFGLSGPEYGGLVEGDEGTLTYQGTRYHGFRRAAAKALVDRDF